MPLLSSPEKFSLAMTSATSGKDAIRPLVALGIGNEILVRLVSAVSEVALFRQLEMAGLRVDDGLAELDEDVLDESLAQDAAQ